MNSKLLFYHFVNVQTGGANKYLWKTLEHNGVLFPPEYEKRGFNIFGISIDIREHHKENFKKIFRQKYVNIVELDQMKTRLIRKIEEFTKTLE